jgi:hypothetical protein
MAGIPETLRLVRVRPRIGACRCITQLTRLRDLTLKRMFERVRISVEAERGFWMRKSDSGESQKRVM